jgi:hypothetical protein
VGKRWHHQNGCNRKRAAKASIRYKGLAEIDHGTSTPYKSLHKSFSKALGFRKMILDLPDQHGCGSVEMVFFPRPFVSRFPVSVGTQVPDPGPSKVPVFRSLSIGKVSIGDLQPTILPPRGLSADAKSPRHSLNGQVHRRDGRASDRDRI